MLPSQASIRAVAAETRLPKPVVAAAGPMAGSNRSAAGMVTTTFGLTRAQERQVAGGELVVGQLHERVGVLLGAGPQVTLRPVGLHDRLEGGLQLLPADRRRAGRA